METVKIHGKEYATVAGRIDHFRSTYPNFSIETEIVLYNESQIAQFEQTKEAKSTEGNPVGLDTWKILKGKDAECVIKATIKNPEGVVIATGLAHEKEGATNINKTSFVENCETSAIGRALACMGIGLTDSYASAEEVANAISNQ